MKIILLIFSLLIFYGTAQAQFPKNWVAKDTLHDYCRLCQEGQHSIGEPYNHSWKKEWPFLLTSAAVFGTGYYLTTTDKTKPFDTALLRGLDKNVIKCSFPVSEMPNREPYMSFYNNLCIIFNVCENLL